MAVSEALQAGFALAATIARDPGAEHAHIGIAPDVSDAWCGLARDLTRLSKAERREKIRKLARAHRTRRLPALPLSRRGLALLAGRTAVRAGFAPEPALVAHLARIAQRFSAP